MNLYSAANSLYKIQSGKYITFLYIFYIKNEGTSRKNYFEVKEHLGKHVFFLLCFMRCREMEKGQNIYLLIFVTFSHFLCVFSYLFFWVGGSSVPRPFQKQLCFKYILCCKSTRRFYSIFCFAFVFTKENSLISLQREKKMKNKCVSLCPKCITSHRCNLYCMTQTVCFLSNFNQKGSIGN